MRGWQQGVAIAMGALLSFGAGAMEGSLQAGMTHQATVGSASTVWIQGRGDLKPVSARVSIEPVVSLGFVQDRNEPGSQENVWLAGGGVRWHWTPHQSASWPVFVETQVLGAHGRTDALSGPVQFGTALGWSGKRVEVLVRHLSNAGLRGPNRGENQIVVGWRF